MMHATRSGPSGGVGAGVVETPGYKMNVGYNRVVSKRNPSVKQSDGSTSIFTVKDRFMSWFSTEMDEERSTRLRLEGYLKTLQSEIVASEKARLEHENGGKSLQLEFATQELQMSKWGLTNILPVFRLQAWLRVSRAALLEKMAARSEYVLRNRLELAEKAMTIFKERCQQAQARTTSSSSSSAAAVEAAKPLTKTGSAYFLSVFMPSTRGALSSSTGDADAAATGKSAVGQQHTSNIMGRGVIGFGDEDGNSDDDDDPGFEDDHVTYTSPRGDTAGGGMIAVPGRIGEEQPPQNLVRLPKPPTTKRILEEEYPLAAFNDFCGVTVEEFMGKDPVFYSLSARLVRMDKMCHSTLHEFRMLVPELESRTYEQRRLVLVDILKRYHGWLTAPEPNYATTSGCVDTNGGSTFITVSTDTHAASATTRHTATSTAPAQTLLEGGGISIVVKEEEEEANSSSSFGAPGGSSRANTRDVGSKPSKGSDVNKNNTEEQEIQEQQLLPEWRHFCNWYLIRQTHMADLEREFANFVEDEREREGRLFRKWCAIADAAIYTRSLPPSRRNDGIGGEDSATPCKLNFNVPGGRTPPTISTGTATATAPPSSSSTRDEETNNNHNVAPKGDCGSATSGHHPKQHSTRTSSVNDKMLANVLEASAGSYAIGHKYNPLPLPPTNPLPLPPTNPLPLPPTNPLPLPPTNPLPLPPTTSSAAEHATAASTAPVWPIDKVTSSITGVGSVCSGDNKLSADATLSAPQEQHSSSDGHSSSSSSLLSPASPPILLQESTNNNKDVTTSQTYSQQNDSSPSSISKNKELGSNNNDKNNNNKTTTKRPAISPLMTPRSIVTFIKYFSINYLAEPYEIPEEEYGLQTTLQILTENLVYRRLNKLVFRYPPITKSLLKANKSGSHGDGGHHCLQKKDELWRAKCAVGRRMSPITLGVSPEYMLGPSSSYSSSSPSNEHDDVAIDTAAGDDAKLVSPMRAAAGDDDTITSIMRATATVGESSVAHPPHTSTSTGSSSGQGQQQQLSFATPLKSAAAVASVSTDSSSFPQQQQKEQQEQQQHKKDNNNNKNNKNLASIQRGYGPFESLSLSMRKSTTTRASSISSSAGGFAPGSLAGGTTRSVSLGSYSASDADVASLPKPPLIPHTSYSSPHSSSLHSEPAAAAAAAAEEGEDEQYSTHTRTSDFDHRPRTSTPLTSLSKSSHSLADGLTTPQHSHHSRHDVAALLSSANHNNRHRSNTSSSYVRNIVNHTTPSTAAGTTTTTTAYGEPIVHSEVDGCPSFDDLDLDDDSICAMPSPAVAAVAAAASLIRGGGQEQQRRQTRQTQQRSSGHRSIIVNGDDSVEDDLRNLSTSFAGAASSQPYEKKTSAATLLDPEDLSPIKQDADVALTPIRAAADPGVDLLYFDEDEESVTATPQHLGYKGEINLIEFECSPVPGASTTVNNTTDDHISCRRNSNTLSSPAAIFATADNVDNGDDDVDDPFAGLGLMNKLVIDDGGDDDAPASRSNIDKNDGTASSTATRTVASEIEDAVMPSTTKQSGRTERDNYHDINDNNDDVGGEDDDMLEWAASSSSSSSGSSASVNIRSGGGSHHITPISTPAGATPTKSKTALTTVDNNNHNEASTTTDHNEADTQRTYDGKNQPQSQSTTSPSTPPSAAAPQSSSLQSHLQAPQSSNSSSSSSTVSVVCPVNCSLCRSITSSCRLQSLISSLQPFRTAPPSFSAALPCAAAPATRDAIVPSNPPRFTTSVAISASTGTTTDDGDRRPPLSLSSHPASQSPTTIIAPSLISPSSASSSASSSSSAQEAEQQSGLIINDSSGHSCYTSSHYPHAIRVMRFIASSVTPHEITNNLLFAMKWLMKDAARISKKSGEYLDADLMFPLLVWILLHAEIPFMHLILHFLGTYGDSDDHGESAYYITCLHAAVEFILRLDIPKDLIDTADSKTREIILNSSSSAHIAAETQAASILSPASAPAPASASVSTSISTSSPVTTTGCKLPTLPTAPSPPENTIMAETTGTMVKSPSSPVPVNELDCEDVSSSLLLLEQESSSPSSIFHVEETTTRGTTTSGKSIMLLDDEVGGCSSIEVIWRDNNTSSSPLSSSLTNNYQWSPHQTTMIAAGAESNCSLDFLTGSCATTTAATAAITTTSLLPPPFSVPAPVPQPENGLLQLGAANSVSSSSSSNNDDNDNHGDHDQGGEEEEEEGEEEGEEEEEEAEEEDVDFTEEEAVAKLGEWLRDQQTMEETISILLLEGWMV